MSDIRSVGGGVDQARKVEPRVGAIFSSNSLKPRVNTWKIRNEVVMDSGEEIEGRV